MDIVEVLKNLPIGKRENSPTFPENDSTNAEGEFFCVEDKFSSSDIQVSVHDVGPIHFPINEETVKKLIAVSEKAKFGKGTKTVLDTTYRDTQTISARNLNVNIDQRSLGNVLKRVGEELNIQENSTLEVHLYNMLIYGPGQFFKKHRDTEKIPNMVATLVIVLPSAYTGGGLIIEHNGLSHKFHGYSLNPEIIKCVTFYADCFHEVEEIKEGYRVALTYNVELKFGPLPDLRPVNENLRNVVKNYFSNNENADKLVYYLDHQYTENSLRWHFLKGSDQSRAKALLAVAKREGYCPCLSLVEYHESYQEGCRSSARKWIKLYFWIDENNQRFDNGEIEISEDEICCTMDTKKFFDPFKRTEEGYMGNWSGNIDEWYHRSCVVLWKNNWSYLQGYKIKLVELHRLTTQMEMKSTLLKNLKDNEENYFLSKFWTDDAVKKMILDIVIYLNDTEMTLKILKELKPADVFDLGKSELVNWIANAWNLELWKSLIEAWNESYNLAQRRDSSSFTKFISMWESRNAHCPEKILASLLPFLLQYMAKEDKNLDVAEYLLIETANIFVNLNVGDSSYERDRSASNKLSSERLCALLQICSQLGRLDLECQLMTYLKSTSSAEEVVFFKIFEESLDTEQFKRISGALLSNMTKSSFEKIEKEKDKYFYSAPKQADLQIICSLLENCIKVGNESLEQKILNDLMSDITYSASFLAELFVKMKRVLGDRVNNYPEFKSHVINLIDGESVKLRKPNDWGIPFKHPCGCEFCRKVQEFFVSTISNQLDIPTAERNRKHISRYLDSWKSMPIKYETIRGGSPYTLRVTKLPKLQKERQNLANRLMICKRDIVDTVQGAHGNSPAAKRFKVQH